MAFLLNLSLTAINCSSPASGNIFTFCLASNTNALPHTTHRPMAGQSERTNRTVIQAIRYHVERNQSGWKRALPHIHFNIMSTLNVSTGFSPFQLRFGKSPRIVPPLINIQKKGSPKLLSAQKIIYQLLLDVAEAKDNLRTAKINQSFYANHN
jgi:hypothetical protein